MVRDPSIPPSDHSQREEPTGLSSSRAEFAATLSRRLDSVLGALSALEQQPNALGRRDNFLRRVHALGASSRVLGFAAAAEVLSRVEQHIRTIETETLADGIQVAKRQLQELPSFVLRGPYSLTPPSAKTPPARSAPPLIAEPLAVVVWGTSDLLDGLKSLDKNSGSLELASTDDPSRLRELCATFGPDVLLLDANQGSITLLVDELAQAPEIAGTAIVVINVPDEAAPRLLELGAKAVLPSSATDQQLSRALLQARHVAIERPPPTPTPYGDLSLKELAERLSQELRQGLVDAATPNAQFEPVRLGDGTVIRAALWSAMAQIREHITEATQGRIRFASGPEGAVLLAPRSGGSPRSPGQSRIDTIDLSGRRILVVDDDPAVAWFVGGTLRAAGAIVTEVHDGAQALQLAYRIWPELIVSDVVMPGLDGFALCHAIKRDVLLRDVPIILLSWKEDLLFRLRDLGADADGYLRKEADASTIVRRVRELLLPRAALESRLTLDQETRGRLDGTTTRLLLELTAGLDRPVRIALRDSSAIYDIRMRHGSLATVTRTRHDGTVEQGDSVLGAMLGIGAGRFSVLTDRDPCDALFTGSLPDILQPSVLRARAAQRVLSGLTLGLIDRLTLEPNAFGSDLPLLPLSLRPIADELLRGTAPRQLLASGVASVQLLETLLSDVARRGAVRAIADATGDDLLHREILALSATPTVIPPRPAPGPPPLFSFQLSPPPPEADDAHAPTSPTPTQAIGDTATVEPEAQSTAAARRKPVVWELPSGTLPGIPRDEALAAAGELAPPGIPAAAPIASGTWSPSTTTSPHAPPAVVPVSKPPLADDVDWAMELNWDSTPPPRTTDPKDPQPAPPSRPATSGGFMRPAIAPLERRTLNDTPDLANAVVRAVSEVTPAPVVVSAVTKPTPVSKATPLAEPTNRDPLDPGHQLSTAMTLAEPNTRDPRDLDHQVSKPGAASTMSKPDTPAAVPEADSTANRPGSPQDRQAQPSTGATADAAPDAAPPVARDASPLPSGSVKNASLDASLQLAPVAKSQLDATSLEVTTAVVASAAAASAAVSPTIASAAAASILTPVPGSRAPVGAGAAPSTTSTDTVSPAALDGSNHVPVPPAPARVPDDGKDASKPIPSPEPPLPAKPKSSTAGAESRNEPAASQDQLATEAAPIIELSSTREGLESEGAQKATPTPALPVAVNPAPLPVVHQPPRPQSPATLGRTQPMSFERDGEDPIFPLVSTANVPLEIQTSIDVGAPTNQPDIAEGPLDPPRVDPSQTTQNRDTLRSPGDPASPAPMSRQDNLAPTPPRHQDEGNPQPTSHELHGPASDTSPVIGEAPPSAKPEPTKPGSPIRPPTDGNHSARPGSEDRAPERRTSDAAPEQAQAIDSAIPDGSDIRSTHRSAAPPDLVLQHPRPVGWIQAFGLAALAGIVTFAVTVPIAGWIRKRQEPNITEPPVAVETSPSPSSDGASPPTLPSTATDTNVLGSGSEISDISRAPSAAVAETSATIEELQAPSDTSLPPGQAMIEVVTGGGHAIFFDDAFVGRGPTRVITVQPGRHIVRTRLNGVERSDPIEIGAGRFLRLSLEQAWK